MKRLMATVMAVWMLLSMAACDLSMTEAFTDTDEQSEQSSGEAIVMEYDPERISENIQRLKNDKGFLIEMTVVSDGGGADESTSFVYAESKDAFYYKEGENEILFDFSHADKCVTYEKNADGAWEKQDTIYADGVTREMMEEQVALYELALTGYFGNHAGLAGQTVQTASVQVAGRDCDMYTYSAVAMGVSIEYVFCVDRETGMCLKWEMNAADGMEAASAEYVCTRFETPYVIPIPADAIDVTDQHGY